MLHQDPSRVACLFSAETLRDRCAALGATLTQDYAGREVLAVCVLRGAIPFFADLVRHIDLPLVCDTLAVSSYEGGTTSTGRVRLVSDLRESVEGRHVLLVEDIVDTGLTARFLLQLIEERGAASVELVSLLDKPARRQVAVDVRYVGFTIEDHFVVGYGLDLDQRLRNLPYVGVLRSPSENAAS